MKQTPTELKHEIELHRRNLSQRGVDSGVRVQDEVKLHSLANKGYPEAISALTNVLSELKNSQDYHDVWVRRYIAQSLGDCDQVSAFAGLYNALEDPDPEVRIHAITGATISATSIHREAEFREFAKKEAWNMVETAKRDSNPDVRQRAFECLQALMEEDKDK
jgi:hypothetical protein